MRSTRTSCCPAVSTEPPASDPYLLEEDGWSGITQTLAAPNKDRSLQLLAHDHRGALDVEKAATLICEKFEREKTSGRYRNIRTIAELASTFSTPARIKLIHDSWNEDLGTQVLFLPQEEERAEGSLVDFANVERYVNEAWTPILAEASRRSSRR